MAGSCSTPTHSTTGIPEGCSMAVACMAALSLVAAKNAETLGIQILSVFFADNRSFICNSVQDIKMAIQYLYNFVQEWKMNISPTKSWTWSNKIGVRMKLKSIKINGCPIEVKTHAIDLGCDVTYTGRKANHSTRQRTNDATKRLGKIRGKKWPTKFKRTVAKQAGHAVALYGIVVGKKQLQQLI